MTTPKPHAGSGLFLSRNLITATALLCAMSWLHPKASARPAADDTKKAEKPYALIYGTVFGPDDRAVYGVKIKIRRANEKKARWEHYSDHAGEFAQRVPAGKADYVVWADLKGYKSRQYKSLQGGPEVTVHIDNDERSDISLHLKK